MKTVFFGTPAIAVPFLAKLQKLSEVVAVVTSPDQPAGRGYEVKAPEVKVQAQCMRLPIHQPEKATDPAFLEQLKQWAPEVGIVVAYGKLLPKPVLEVPKYGFLNVHFSLLPAYRGAAPIQWALINGEKETGVTLFWLDEGMDTGPIFLQRKIQIGSDDAETLRHKLVELGVLMLEEAIDLLKRGEKKALPQTGTASRAPILKKEDGKINWSDSAQAIVQRIRGTTPWPGAFTLVSQAGQSLRLKILAAQATDGSASGTPGAVVRVEESKAVVIKCGQGLLEVSQLQPEGKKPMAATDWWLGARLKLGEVLGKS